MLPVNPRTYCGAQRGSRPSAAARGCEPRHRPGRSDAPDGEDVASAAPRASDPGAAALRPCSWKQRPSADSSSGAVACSAGVVSPGASLAGSGRERTDSRPVGPGARSASCLSPWHTNPRRPRPGSWSPGHALPRSGFGHHTGPFTGVPGRPPHPGRTVASGLLALESSASKF